MAVTINLQKFIPQFLLNLFSSNNFNNAYLLGQRGPIWIGVSEPKQLYNSIPELKAVVDRNATMFSNMKLYKRSKKTKVIIPDPELDRLLDNPNCTQGQNQFLKQYRTQLLCYGNQFIYKNQLRTSKIPVALWNVSPFYLQPVLSGKLFDQVKMEDIISEYKMINTLSVGGANYENRNFKSQEILYTRIEDIDNPIIGRSPIAAMKYPLSNIETSYTARNVGHQHVGVGILSPKVTKDGFGQMALDAGARKDMEGQMGIDYGIKDGQRRTILSNASVEFSSMAIATKDMMLIEEVNADMAAVCNIYNTSPQIFLTDTTYENLRSSIVQMYQDNIIPAADEFCQALTPFLGLDQSEEICASFEHLSILKENKLKGMQAIESIVKSLAQAVEAKLIKAEQATRILATELGLGAASF